MLTSKLVVAAGFSLLVGVVATGLTVAASSVLALVHRQPLTGLDQVVAMAGRGVVVVMILGVLGFCVGLLTGSTGASIGVLLGGLVATYARLILSVTSRWAERLAAWSPEVNLSAILHAGTTYPVSTGTGAVSEESGELPGAVAEPGPRPRLLGAAARRPDRGHLAGVPAPGRLLTGSGPGVRPVPHRSRPGRQRVG